MKQLRLVKTLLNPLYNDMKYMNEICTDDYAINHRK